MVHKVKVYSGSPEEKKSLGHLLEAAENIVEDYFIESYAEIIRSKSYSIQQIAAAYIYMGYYALRSTMTEEAASNAFDLISDTAKTRTEELIKITGKDPLKKRLS